MTLLQWWFSEILTSHRSLLWASYEISIVNIFEKRDCYKADTVAVSFCFQASCVVQMCWTRMEWVRAWWWQRWPHIWPTRGSPSTSSFTGYMKSKSLMITTRLVWTIWTSMSAVLKKAIKLNHSLTTLLQEEHCTMPGQLFHSQDLFLSIW